MTDYPLIPLADVDGDGCICDEWGPGFCDWLGDHIEDVEVAYNAVPPLSGDPLNEGVPV